MYYHIGSGSSKAEFPKSVVKYLKKLKINAGKMESTGVNFKKAKSNISIHFSNFWTVSMYKVCDLGFFIPMQRPISISNHFG